MLYMFTSVEFLANQYCLTTMLSPKSSQAGSLVRSAAQQSGSINALTCNASIPHQEFAATVHLLMVPGPRGKPDVTSDVRLQ